MRYTIRMLTMGLLVFGLLSCGSQPAQPKTSSAGAYAVYGNWCGPDHPWDATMADAPGPLDQLDAACMIHDYCYAQSGYLNCDCDETLTTLLKQQLASREYTSAQAVAARSIHNYFTASPCKDYTGGSQGKTAANRGVYRLYEGIKRRTQSVIETITGP